MKIKIYPSNVNIDSPIEPCYLMAHYFLLLSIVIKDKITISNIKLNDYLIQTIKVLEKIGIEITFFGLDSCYITNNIKQVKDVIEINDTNEITLKYLFPLSLNLTKKLVFNVNKNIDLSSYKYILDNSNIFIKKENNKIIFSGYISNDYLDLPCDMPLIIGFILNSLYLKKAITIKVNNLDKIKNELDLFIDVCKKTGNTITYDTNYIYVHNEQTILWDDFVIEGDFEKASYFIALASLNGSFKSTYLKENSKQECYEIINIIKKMGGMIKFIQDDDNYLYAYNNSLFEKGIAKKLNGIVIESINENLLYLIMVVASFSKGKTIIKNEKENKFINILKKLKVDINYQDNNIIIKGKNNYQNKINIDCLNDFKITASLIIFALLNNGCIILENASNEVIEMLEILKKATKEHAISFSDVGKTDKIS